MEWIIKNKEWIFSGVGATVITLVVNAFFQRKEEGNKIIMNQKNGQNSINNQSADKIEIQGDMKINVKK